MENLIPEPQHLHYADLILDTGLLRAYRGGGVKKIKLTYQEYKLLYLFMTHPDTVITRKAIINVGWGKEEGRSNIVEVYIRYLRKKLGDPVLIQTVRGAGYMLHEEK